MNINKPNSSAARSVIAAAMVGLAQQSGCLPVDRYCTDGEYFTQSSARDKAFDRGMDPEDLEGGGYGGPDSNGFCMGWYAAKKGFDKDEIFKDQAGKVLDKFGPVAADKIGDSGLLPESEYIAPLRYTQEQIKNEIGRVIDYHLGYPFGGVAEGWDSVIGFKDDGKMRFVTACDVWKNSVLNDLPNHKCLVGDMGNVVITVNSHNEIFFGNHPDTSPGRVFSVKEDDPDFQMVYKADPSSTDSGDTIEIRALDTRRKNTDQYITAPEGVRTLFSGENGSHFSESGEWAEIRTHHDMIRLLQKSGGNNRFKGESLYELDLNKYIYGGRVDFSSVTDAEITEIYSLLERHHAEIFSNVVNSAVEPSSKPIASILPEEIAKHLKKPLEVYQAGQGNILDLATIIFDWCKRSGLQCDTYFVKDGSHFVGRVIYGKKDGTFSKIDVGASGLHGEDGYDSPPITYGDEEIVYTLPWSTLMSHMER